MPARRASARPIATACREERAPGAPRRILRIASRTNTPACVLAARPARLILRALMIVRFSGMRCTPETSGVPVSAVAHYQVTQPERTGRAFDPAHDRPAAGA